MNNYKRKKDPIENRKLILDCATELIAEVGLEKWTLEGLAKKAGLSKGGVLHHFPKKEAIIEELFKASVDSFQQAIEQEKGKGVSLPLAYLKAAIQSNVDEGAKSSQMVFQALWNSPDYRTLLRQWNRDHLIADTESTSPEDLIAVLVADGLWFANIYGTFDISMKQAERIEQVIKTLLSNYSIKAE